ncbi:MAG TPA: hypothetical protein VNF06_02035 [Candidatus Aquilonibacter sp.]|nr:hypothetical protein [Candidatus Aquilonibacter sp.]
METWKAITGIILFLIGAVVALQGYNTLNNCGSVVGMIGTFVSAIIGGNGTQSCYNAQVAQYGGVILAIIGLVVIYTAQKPMKKSGRK